MHQTCDYLQKVAFHNHDFIVNSIKPIRIIFSINPIVIGSLKAQIIGFLVARVTASATHIFSQWNLVKYVKSTWDTYSQDVAQETYHACWISSLGSSGSDAISDESWFERRTKCLGWVAVGYRWLIGTKVCSMAHFANYFICSTLHGFVVILKLVIKDEHTCVESHRPFWHEAPAAFSILNCRWPQPVVASSAKP